MNKLNYLIILVFLSACATPKPEMVETEQATTTIYLVRHAEKADDGTPDPPLTARGKKRAQLLSEILLDKNIDRIYSSDYKRTKQTAIPLSRAIKVAIASYDPRNLPEIVGDLNNAGDQNILVVGHSNSTPSLANLLLEREEMEKFDESDYDNLLIVTIKGDERKIGRLTFTLDEAE